MAPTPSGGGLNSRVKYDWNAHKESIVRLYQEKGFKVMKKEMTKRGFSPTRRSYFNKFNEWGIEKNIRTQDMRFMVHKRRKMRGLGKMTIFKLHGKVVPERKLDRFEQRELCNGGDVSDECGCDDPKTPEGMSYCALFRTKSTEIVEIEVSSVDSHVLSPKATSHEDCGAVKRAQNIGTESPCGNCQVSEALDSIKGHSRPSAEPGLAISPLLIRTKETPLAEITGIPPSSTAQELLLLIQSDPQLPLPMSSRHQPETDFVSPWTPNADRFSTFTEPMEPADASWVHEFNEGLLNSSIQTIARGDSRSRLRACMRNPRKLVKVKSNAKLRAALPTRKMEIKENWALKNLVLKVVGFGSEVYRRASQWLLGFFRRSSFGT